jgi:hypothetical protein
MDDDGELEGMWQSGGTDLVRVATKLDDVMIRRRTMMGD